MKESTVNPGARLIKELYVHKQRCVEVLMFCFGELALQCYSSVNIAMLKSCTFMKA